MISILTSVLGEAIAAIVGAGVVLLVPWLIRRRVKTEERYNSAWTIDYPKKKAQKYDTIESTLVLRRHGRNEIRGEGQATGFGPYTIKGVDAKFCSVLLYYGVKHREGVAGVAIVQKRPDEAISHGKWIEIDEDYELIHGSVTLTRIDV